MAPPRDDETDVPGGRDALDLPVARVMPRDRRRGRSLETLVALVVLGVVIAVLKPWTGVGDGLALPVRGGRAGRGAGRGDARPDADRGPVPGPGRGALPGTERMEDVLDRAVVRPARPKLGRDRPAGRCQRPGEPAHPLRRRVVDGRPQPGLLRPPQRASERPASGATAAIFQLAGSSPPAGRASASDWEQIRPGARVARGGRLAVRRGVGAARWTGAVTWPSGWYVFAIGDRAALRPRSSTGSGCISRSGRRPPIDGRLGQWPGVTQTVGIEKSGEP